MRLSACSVGRVAGVVGEGPPVCGRRPLGGAGEDILRWLSPYLPLLLCLPRGELDAVSDYRKTDRCRKRQPASGPGVVPSRSGSHPDNHGGGQYALVS